MGISIEDLHNLNALHRSHMIHEQRAIIKHTENTIKDYWNLPDDWKGEFTFSCPNFDTNKHYENTKLAKAKLILLGVNPDEDTKE